MAMSQCSVEPQQSQFTFLRNSLKWICDIFLQFMFFFIHMGRLLVLFVYLKVTTMCHIHVFVMKYKQTIIVISNKVVISIRNHSWCSKIKMQRNQYVANHYINKACGLSIAKKPKTLWYQISLALKMTVKSTITSSLLPFHCEWLLFYNFRYWNTCNKFDNRCKTIQQNISKGLNKKKLQTQSYFNLHF